MKRNIIVVTLVAALMAVFVIVTRMQTGAISPPVTGFLDGEEIRFVHTEASDRTVADTLAAMVGSPVFVVPALAQVPASALAIVYVFTNGIRGDGPLGGQPDVFDAPPNTPGYSPLRDLHLVTWQEGRSARQLRAAAEVKAAEARGDLVIERPGIVVNMPLQTWPGGRR